MTESEAAGFLMSPLSGPSARYDAEQLLTELGWPGLAIALLTATTAGERQLAVLRKARERERTARAERAAQHSHPAGLYGCTSLPGLRAHLMQQHMGAPITCPQLAQGTWLTLTGLHYQDHQGTADQQVTPQ